MQYAEPDFRGMSLAGYDAMALGNHEFDNPSSVLRQQQKWATFPLLSANIYQKSTGHRLFQPWAVFDRSGLKIAVIGLTTDDTIKVSDPRNLSDIELHKPATEAREVVETLRTTVKPDVIIAATHMGHYDDGKHGLEAPGDVSMARELPTGFLDLIVGGHTQQTVCMENDNHTQKDYIPGTPCLPDKQNGTWIVQAGEWGKYVGRADFTFRNGKLQLEHYELIPVNLKHKVINSDGTATWVNYTKPAAQDPEMQKLLMPFQEKGESLLDAKIGHVKGHLEGDRRKVRTEQTNLARLLLTAMREKANADFALINGGAIRDSIRDGDISYRDILKMLPFKSTLAYVEMDGREVKKYLTHVVNGTKNYTQFANVSLVSDGQDVHDIKIDGWPLNPDKIYRLATIDYLAAGGADYPVLDNRLGFVSTGIAINEILKSYIEQHSPLDASSFEPANEIVYSLSHPQPILAEAGTDH